MTFRKIVSLLVCLVILLGAGASCSAPVTSPFAVSSAKPSLQSSAEVSLSPALTGALTANFLNVGQGDSEFIALPNGQTMLIDAGNPGDGAGIVQYIKAAGFTKIDYLVATHPHADHIGGMADVINGIDIGSIYMPKVADTTETYENLISAIKTKGLTVKTAKAGVSLVDSGDLKVYMIAPNGSKYEDLNNYSAVIQIIYKRTSFLFMGDAQTLSENEILDAGADVRADVLKVGHHGSDTSSGLRFLLDAHREYAVISVGAGNDYGYPKQTTLDKLRKVGAKVFRTDQDGSVIITSDGSKLSVTTSAFSTVAGKTGGGTTSNPAAPATTAPAAY